jgi:hypothetical protein
MTGRLGGSRRGGRRRHSGGALALIVGWIPALEAEPHPQVKGDLRRRRATRTEPRSGLRFA